MNKLTTEEVYRRYPDLKPGQRYKGSTEKMIFLCPTHGRYGQSVNSHSHGSGCQKCGVLRAIRRPRQKPGKLYTFRCGCSGILPAAGKSNKFAVWKDSQSSFVCRVPGIFSHGKAAARKHGYKFPKNVSHSVIREMMETDCWRCGKPLDWSSLGSGKTPHLHHDHETGEILGFTHMRCNSHVELTVDELKRQLAEVETIAENPENWAVEDQE
jgi:hypothetical protein